MYRSRTRPASAAAMPGMLVRLRRRYVKALEWTAIRHPVPTLGLVIVIVIVTGGAIAVSGFNPETDSDRGIRRGELTVSVATGGASPSLARRIREELETRFGEEYADFVAVLGEVRREVFERVSDRERRMAFFRAVDHEKWLAYLREHGRDALKRAMLEAINRSPSPSGGGSG